jgi:glycosyltransferase involved in cell wall biosynthesis
LKMARCLFLAGDWPIMPDAPGGAGALIYSHLELLAHTDCEIVLLVLCGADNQNCLEDVIGAPLQEGQTVRSWCATIGRFELKQAARRSAPLRYALLALQDPTTTYVTPAPETRRAWHTLLKEVEPDVIWAEHLRPGTFAVQNTPQNGQGIPVIYSHHDWSWKIKRHRVGAGASRLRSSVKFWFRRRHEEALVRQAAGCVTASASEAKEIKALGNGNVVQLPATYLPVTLANGEDGPPRIVHLGGMQTTANREGLQRFMAIVWPRLLRALPERPELWVVGSLSGAPAKLRAALDEAGAVCTGFVPDLTTALRPGDLHIIPWEYDTGTRTRIPLALNHGQVIVSTRAAATCLPQLQDGVNGVLVEDLQGMADEIVSLYQDYGRRQRLAAAGRETFLEHFTREALQPRLNRFLYTIAEERV